MAYFSSVTWPKMSLSVHEDCKHVQERQNRRALVVIELSDLAAISTCEAVALSESVPSL